MEDENKNKYDLLMHLLSEGDVMVCLDARRPEVEVPARFKNDACLNLVLNLNFRRPIEIAPEGISATLSFGGRPHPCSIPFEPIWAIYEPGTQKGQVWEDSVPKDLNLMDRISENTDPQQSQKISKRGSPPRKPAADTEKPKKDRSHLRVIK